MKNSRLWLLAMSLVAVWLVVSQAQGAVVLDATLTTLATFNNTNGGGASPFAPPVMGPDGTLYGTTAYADTAKGTNLSGVIYEITTNGDNITLYTFNQTNGSGAFAPLIFGRDGNLYGVTTAGGTNKAGTLFRLTTNGIFTVLYSFGHVRNKAGMALDGTAPSGGLVQGQDGFLYGTTYSGGASNLGTIFQFSTNDNTLGVLHSFLGSDGANPKETPLVEGPAGVFYGTTYGGGANSNGTIFEITSEGVFLSLYQFSGTNGQGVANGLSFGADGDLFGTTVQGGTNGDGTVFRLDTFGNLTTLFQFDKTNGMAPQGGITVGPNEVLYGTTDQGGSKGLGTIFQLLTNGQLTTLYSFTNKNNGANPASGVILDDNGSDSGSLYGTTQMGGTNGGRGTVYRLQFAFLPTVAFTSPKVNQRWSNDVFTVRGTVSTNFNVTNVAYSVNGGTWTNATTTNNWTNWTGQVALIPGTNSIAAYATDLAGNISPTNTVKMDFVVTTPITVLTSGDGDVSPDYNTESLHIGTIYSMTAKAAKGSEFIGWTDGNSNEISALPKLTFVMTNGLAFIAFFADTSPPTITITAPKTGARWSNDVYSVTGTAKDNVAVSNVFVSVNGGGWNAAALSATKSGTNWNANVDLLVGTNTIAAYAEDPSGNLSITDSVKLDYIVTTPVTVSIVGEGTVKTDLNGEYLAISNNYTMKATAAKGFSFFFWNVGADMTDSATLTFTMVPGLAITANFKDVTVPTVAITAPKANAKESNDTINVTGKATDNVGVTAVGVRINGGEWTILPVAGTSLLWTNLDMPVIRGTNTLQAYAEDATGNISTTNIVKFLGELPPDWAPDTLAGSTVEVTPSSGDPVTASFDADTFSQTDIITNGDSGIGIYTYTKNATNAADLQLSLQLPLVISNGVPQDIQLTFTGLNSGVFTNEEDNGIFDIVPTTTFVPASWSGHTITATSSNNAAVTTFKITSTTKATVTSGGTTLSDTYVADPASPVSAMLVVTEPGAVKVHEVQLTFTSKSGGHYEVNNIDDGGMGDSDFGTFTFK